jgi:hypothetical protein
MVDYFVQLTQISTFMVPYDRFWAGYTKMGNSVRYYWSKCWTSILLSFIRRF